MDKENRFTDQAFSKVTEEKTIEKAKRRAKEVPIKPPTKEEDKKIS